jgi:hypothetical protein
MRWFEGLTLVAAGLVVTGCAMQNDAAKVTAAPPPAGAVFTTADHVPPNEVLMALPAGVKPADVIVRLDPGPGGPCYYYRGADGGLEPVVTVNMAKAGITDLPYCIM